MDGDCSHETKMLVPWKKSNDKPRQSIKKQRHHFKKQRRHFKKQRHHFAYKGLYAAAATAKSL